MAHFDTLPDELIVQILQHVSGDDLVCTVQRLSRRFRALSIEPRLWLARCQTDYAFWGREKKALLRLAGSGRLATRGLVGKGPWRRMWLERRAADVETAAHFEKILLSKVYRVRYTERICSRGVEAKDYLVAQYRQTDGEDILARRYYADSAIQSINRAIAIEEWSQIRDNFRGYSNLERGLAAYDMFILHDGNEDIDGVGAILDQRVAEFRASMPGLDTMTVRQKAMALLHWVRAQDLVGMHEADSNYRNLRNCFITYALSDFQGDGSGGNHPSLPLISSAIYVGMAQRLGLQAYCCTIPGHVHATVLAPPGETLDGTRLEKPQPGLPMYVPVGKAEQIARQQRQPLPEYPLSEMQPYTPEYVPEAQHSMSAEQLQTYSIPDNGSRMYLDPYGRDEEVSLLTLRQNLAATDLGHRIHNELYLYPATTTELVLRMAFNFKTHVNEAFVHTERREDLLLLHQRDLLQPREDLQNNLALHYQLREHLWRMLGHFEMNSATLESRRSALHNLTSPDQLPPLPAPAYTDITPRGQHLRHGHMYSNIEALSYATVWAEVLMRPVPGVGNVWYDHLETLLSRFAHSYSEDAWIVEKYVVPMCEKEDERLRRAARNRRDVFAHNPQHQRSRDSNTTPEVIIKMVHNLDARQPLVSRRYTQDICEQVRFRVGQVFRHKRFLSMGIINGWDIRNESEGEDGTGSHATGVGGDSNGDNPHVRRSPRKTVYYSALQARGPKQIVKQDSIEIVADARAISPELMAVAGKNFKRFDAETCTFVSNIREFFPDD